jgi:hypothetical protein
MKSERQIEKILKKRKNETWREDEELKTDGQISKGK